MARDVRRRRAAGGVSSETGSAGPRGKAGAQGVPAARVRGSTDSLLHTVPCSCGRWITYELARYAEVYCDHVGGTYGLTHETAAYLSSLSPKKRKKLKGGRSLLNGERWLVKLEDGG